MKKHKAEIFFNIKSILGEGPVWDWRKKRLFWVDIEGKKLFCINTSTQKHLHWNFKSMIGAAVPSESGCFVLALEQGLSKFDIDTEELTPLKVLENHPFKIRFNDGKVGPNGNFWIGTMHKEFVSRAGNLYCVDQAFHTSIKIPDTTISNGMAWSSNTKTFYFIDSPTYEISSYDFDIETGSISNRKIIISVPESYGTPDGMSIDAEGMLWVAHWGGNCVRRWNPDTGRVLETVEVEAPNVTSCCFGGKDLDTLYITTARSGLSQSELQEFPLSGGLFVCRPGVRGTPINYFKDN